MNSWRSVSILAQYSTNIVLERFNKRMIQRFLVKEWSEQYYFIIGYPQSYLTGYVTLVIFFFLIKPLTGIDPWNSGMHERNNPFRQWPQPFFLEVFISSLGHPSEQSYALSCAILTAGEITVEKLPPTDRRNEVEFFSTNCSFLISQTKGTQLLNFHPSLFRGLA